MTKKLFIITLILLIFSFGLYKVADNFDTFFPEPSGEFTQSGVVDVAPALSQKEINQNIVQEKIAKLKSRYAQKGLILAGDDHLQNNEYAQAIKLYNAALKKSPTDEALIQKVAESYFGARRYSISYKRYRQLIGKPNFDIHKTWLALSLSVENTVENKPYLLSEVQKFEGTGEQMFYYMTLLQCIEDFHLCKKSFGEYLNTNLEVSYPPLLAIKNAIETYENFQVDQLYYKNTLIVKALYDEKNYPLSIEIAQDILEEKPGYKPVIKIIAQSYFELGKYDIAKKYLNEVYELDKSDTSVMYMLGVVHSELDDYVLSNIFFNKALEKGFTPSLYVRRFLLNNAIDLDNSEKTLQIFSDIYTLESEGVTSYDLQLALYYNILYDNIVTAKSITKHALEKFPEEADFYGFAGWIAKQDGDLVLAMQHLTRGYEITPDNAMITLNIAQVALLEKNKSQAIVYLKKTIVADRAGQFGSIAQQLLDEL